MTILTIRDSVKKKNNNPQQIIYMNIYERKNILNTKLVSIIILALLEQLLTIIIA